MSRRTFDFYAVNVGRESKTLPDQSLSVKEILARFTRGQSVPGAFYSEDDPQDLSDEELMSQDVLDPFEERQLALEFQEQEYPGAGKAVRQQADGVISQAAAEAPEAPEISPETEDSKNVSQI